MVYRRFLPRICEIDEVDNALNISVVMPTNVFDDKLLQAIDSILAQTLRPLELIVIINGPDTQYIFRELKKKYSNDKTLRLIKTDIFGIAHSLNVGLANARGKYIARMDADDISLPRRLEEQFKILNDHPDISVVGTNFYIVNNNQITGKSNLPCCNSAIRKKLRFMNPIAHPTVLFRKEIATFLGGYSNNHMCEDYDLWLRLSRSRSILFYNLADHLLLYNENFSPGQRKHHQIYVEMSCLQIREGFLGFSMWFFCGSLLSIAKAVWARIR